ncbi:hypothetical protein HN789_02490 [archaeon]|jgi:hypothetical protein|nr:hypothetical protein [archaeon]MBT4021925.1 hypothetical protein [archaeon]MBT4272242.1 hypothetical protein [archaeon]MBT4460778.1 hypothetical protein [archaeon]MBT4858346.1 hypothetical protein [archaeon]
MIDFYKPFPLTDLINKEGRADPGIYSVRIPNSEGKLTNDSSRIGSALITILSTVPNNADGASRDHIIEKSCEFMPGREPGQVGRYLDKLVGLKLIVDSSVDGLSRGYMRSQTAEYSVASRIPPARMLKASI